MCVWGLWWPARSVCSLDLQLQFYQVEICEVAQLAKVCGHSGHQLLIWDCQLSWEQGPSLSQPALEAERLDIVVCRDSDGLCLFIFKVCQFPFVCFFCFPELQCWKYAIFGDIWPFSYAHLFWLVLATISPGRGGLHQSRYNCWAPQCLVLQRWRSVIYLEEEADVLIRIEVDVVEVGGQKPAETPVWPAEIRLWSYLEIRKRCCWSFE